MKEAHGLLIVDLTIACCAITAEGISTNTAASVTAHCVDTSLTAQVSSQRTLIDIYMSRSTIDVFRIMSVDYHCMFVRQHSGCIPGDKSRCKILVCPDRYGHRCQYQGYIHQYLKQTCSIVIECRHCWGRASRTYNT